jgi:OmpR-family two-component system manganese-sensing sensor histidine kinase
VFSTIRWRLTLWYACATALLLVVFAGGFFSYVQWTLIDRIDDTIAHVAEVLPLPSAWTRDAIQKQFQAKADDLEADRIDLEWYDREGHLLWTTFPATVPIPPLPPARNFGVFITVDPPDSEPLRQLTLAIGDMGLIRISHPWFEVSRPVQELLRELLVGTIGVMGAVGVSGWWLSGIAIQPVIESYERLKQFTADASHELRNPIAAIQTNVQVLQTEMPSPTLTVVERLTRRLGTIVEDLLFLARYDYQDLPPLRPCGLADILHQVVEEQQELARETNIDLVLSSVEPQTAVMGDPDQLARLFTNLISNGLAYTPPQGKVTIEQQQGQVKIRDTGMGIAPEHLPLIFQRFYRSQPQTTGSGLGLAIAKAIVDRHGGHIKVESQVNQGTVFTVVLPIASAAK